MTWAELASAVERYSSALYRLGVRPGQTVALQLPTWWRTTALILACWRVGATAAPMDMDVGPADRERVWADLGATVIITVDRWQGMRPGDELAAMAPRLPNLRCRVLLIGSPIIGAIEGTGHVDFAERFEWAVQRPFQVALWPDPTRPAAMLCVPDLSGTPQAVSYTFSALSAPQEAVAEAGLRADDRIFCLQDPTQLAGLVFGLVLPLQAGSTTVQLDSFEPEMADVITVGEEVTVLAACSAVLGRMVSARGAIAQLRTISLDEAWRPRVLMGSCADDVHPGALTTGHTD